jgi:hypothetical protein
MSADCLAAQLDGLMGRNKVVMTVYKLAELLEIPQMVAQLDGKSVGSLAVSKASKLVAK